MGASPAVVNYVMFCAVIALLALLFLLPVAFNEAWGFHPVLPTALDGAIVLFWFCAAVALAAELGVHSCSNRVSLQNTSPLSRVNWQERLSRLPLCAAGVNVQCYVSITNIVQDYVTSNKVMRGASQESSACREAQAATAFLWFGWVLFVASLAMSAMGFKSGGGASGGIRRGPAMAQV